MGNLLLRVGFALSIVGAAVGMTLGAPSGFGRPVAASDVPAAAVAPVVAGYQAAPLPADSQAELNTTLAVRETATQRAATLVGLATTVVLLAVFVILFSYRQRPGGVRASHR